MLDGVSGVGGVEGLGDAGEDVALDENLGAIAGVDSVAAVGVERVVDVAGTEADAGHARVDVDPVVVVLGHVEEAGVLGAVGVGVADEGGLPVVVDVAVGDGDEVSRVGEVDQSIVVVLVVVTVGGEVDVVDPNIGGFLDANGITILSKNLGDTNVADDDVGLFLDEARKHVSMELIKTRGSSLHSEAIEHGLGVLANDAGVAANLDLGSGLGDGTRDNNDLLRGAGNSGGELSEGGDSDSGSAGSTGGATVLAGVTSSSVVESGALGKRSRVVRCAGWHSGD